MGVELAIDVIAERMIRNANATPYAHGGGLRSFRRKTGEMTFTFFFDPTDNQYQLWIQRNSNAPTMDQLGAIRTAFGAPKGFSSRVVTEGPDIIVKTFWQKPVPWKQRSLLEAIR